MVGPGTRALCTICIRRNDYEYFFRARAERFYFSISHHYRHCAARISMRGIIARDYKQ